MVFPWFLCKNGDFTPTTLYHISILLLIPCDESKQILKDIPVKVAYGKNGKRLPGGGNPRKGSGNVSGSSRENGVPDGEKKP